MGNRKGQVLLVVFMMLLLIGTLVAGVSLMWQSGVNNADSARDSLRAFYLAQAGIERARAEIVVANHGSYGNPVVTFPNQPLGGGFYDLSIDWKNANTKEINSIGRYGNSTRAIITRVDNGTVGPPYGNAWGNQKKSKHYWKEQ
jgi:hypothetical protein